MASLETIIKGCIHNNSKCQQVLYNKYYPYAYKIAFRYIYQYQRIADVVNNSFVKLFLNNYLFRTIDQNNIEPQLQELIKRTIINYSIDELHRTKFMSAINSYTEGIWAEAINSKHAITNMLYKELICCVKSLPPMYGVVYNMYVIDGFSHEEIADLLHTSVDTSKSNLSKAKVCLEKLIKSDRMLKHVRQTPSK
jgi:RNA polymerase sigma factor (sigma-70 family)